jgi:hypothetical protein
LQGQKHSLIFELATIHMNRLTFSILLMLLHFSSVGQQKLPFMNYFGSTREETTNKLQEYLNYYHYQGVISETDTTIDIVVNQKGKEWTIFSSFHFDPKGFCDYHIARRCDNFKELALDIRLKDPGYKWVRVDENIYVSNFYYREMTQVFRTDSCVLTKTSPLVLTRKELRIKRRKGYGNGG